MTDFNEILRKSLSIVNDGYQQAVDNIKEVVSNLSDSIKANAGEDFSLEIGEISSDLKGATFRIFLDTDVNDVEASTMNIIDLRIPVGGYPVQLGTFTKSIQSFKAAEQVLNNKSDIEQYFAQQLSEPDSRLIQAIGFAVRRRANK